MEERKFVCKYCNKKFPCGKSLGGHIRTHMSNGHSSYRSKEVKANADDGVAKFDGLRKRKRDFRGAEEEEEEEAASLKPSYGLRENPKKTTKLVHPNAAIQKEKFCKECGKGFLSLKALCGHMACHSEKDKGAMITTTTSKKFENNNSGFGVKQKMVMMMDDNQSDTEISAPNHPRRSRRMRFKTLNTNTNDLHVSSVPLTMNGSSSVSEVEQEHEEIAKCLMLLSKDSGHRGRFVLPTESSENNSVVMTEVKSPSVDMKKGVLSSGVEIAEEKKKKKKAVLYKSIKLKSAEVVDSDNSDSGYFRNGPKKLDLDVPVDNKHLIRNREFKTPTVEERSGFEFEYRNKMLIKNRGRTRGTEPRKLILEDLDYDDPTTDGLTREEDFINWRKRASYNSIDVPSKKTIPNGSFHSEGSWKKQESLNSEKNISSSYDDDDSAYDNNESDESSTDTDAYPAPISHSSSNKFINGKKTSKNKMKLKSKTTREHRCPICYRIFKSGQALGGHKRSHFVGGSEENTIIIKQDSPVVPCLIDLNLPAPVDD